LYYGFALHSGARLFEEHGANENFWIYKGGSKRILEKYEYEELHNICS
jgi:hypothetical protein